MDTTRQAPVPLPASDESHIMKKTDSIGQAPVPLPAPVPFLQMDQLGLLLDLWKWLSICISGFTTPSVSFATASISWEPAPPRLSVVRSWQAGSSTSTMSTFANYFMQKSTATSVPVVSTSLPAVSVFTQASDDACVSVVTATSMVPSMSTSMTKATWLDCTLPGTGGYVQCASTAVVMGVSRVIYT